MILCCYRFIWRLKEATGEKIRKSTRGWFSPPNPSINHNIVWKIYHAGSATWLFKHSIFLDWMSTGSLLWVHGKRTSFLHLPPQLTPECFPFCEAGSGKSVIWFVIFFWSSSLIACTHIDLVPQSYNTSSGYVTPDKLP